MVAGDVLDARFELLAPAAHGAIGSLHRALDRTTQRIVALKVLNARGDDQDERFHREALVLARLDHPAIVRAIAHGIAPSGEPWLAMEWVGGEDLGSFLRRPPQPSISIIVAMVRELARGLGHAHAHGVVHRDVKPSNILLEGDDPVRPKLVDFGLARTGGFPALTATGQLVGTPSYMAPEQARGDRAIGPAADVHALGCVLFEALTLQKTFDGEHAGVVVDKILRGIHARASTLRPDMHPALDAVIEAMLDPDPQRRPADGNAVALLLSEIAAMLPSPSARTIAHVGRAADEIGPPSQPMPRHLRGSVLADRFEIGAAVGAGGMGTVYYARDRSNGNAVALKLPDRSSIPDLERFEREARALAGLTHAAIVRYVAHGTTEQGEPWLAMDWLEGHDLSVRLLGGPLSIDETRTLLLRLSEGLAVAHARGIVHRDIKPSNVFLVDDDVTCAVIVDFGIARSSTEKALTTTGRALGTPGYMAPEQMLGWRDIDARADVFALGCVAFECLVGRPPFAGDDGLPAPMRALLVDAPRARSLRKDVPASLDALVARLLARTREQRPDNAAAVALALAIAEAPAEAITREERRAASVLAGVLRDRSAPVLDAVSKIVRSHAARLEAKTDGELVVTFGADVRSPDEQAIAAARCALQLSASGLVSALAIASGVPVDGRGDIAAVAFQRTGTLVEMSRGRGGAIRVDTQTASEIEHRFRIVRDTTGLWLEDETTLRGRRTVLGKATSCVGRERELANLEGVFAEVCSDGGAASVLLVGEAGIGKSRVVDELIARLVQRSEMQTLLRGTGEPMRAGSPFAILADVVRDWSQVSSVTAPEAQREALLARVLELGRHVTDAVRTAAFLGELAGIPFPIEAHRALSAARADARVMGDSIRSAWEELLVGLTMRGPVVLALEDLHWSDVGTVRLIASTLRRLRDRPLFVLMTARPEVDTSFPDLFSGSERLAIEALTPRAARRLVDQVLGRAHDERATDGIVDGARGNPLYLEELLRATDRADDAPPGDASATLLALLHRRLDSFDLEMRRVLRAGSVFGARFTRGGLAAILGARAEDESIGSRLAELVEREVLAHAAAPSTFVFRHALFRDASYATFTEEDRRLAHSLAASFLERSETADAVALAEHFQLAGSKRQAARWYARAATLAVESGDVKAAIERADRALDCEPDRAMRVELLILQADVHFYAGALDAAVEKALAARADAPLRTAPWYRALATAISAAGQRGDNERVAVWTLEAEAPPAADEVRASQLTCLARGATQLYGAGRAEPAHGAMEAIDRLVVNAATTPETRSWMARARGAKAGHERRFDLTARELEIVAREQDAAGDDRSACQTRVLEGSTLAILGALADAEGKLLAARANAQRLGVDYLASWAEYGLGKIAALRGDLAGARERLSAVIKALPESPRIVAGAYVYLSIAEHRAGDATSAAREAQAALDLKPAATMQAAARAALARAHALRGDRAAALADATVARRVLDDLGGTLVEFEGLVRLAHAEALRINDRHADARTEIELAATNIRDAAARLSDDRFRAFYTESLEIHAHILRFARTWAAPGATTP